MESHVDGMELFEVKIQLNQLKDLQLERKKLDEKIEKTIHQLEHKIHRVSLKADTTLKPGQIGVDSVTSSDHQVTSSDRKPHRLPNEEEKRQLEKAQAIWKEIWPKSNDGQKKKNIVQTVWDDIDTETYNLLSKSLLSKKAT